VRLSLLVADEDALGRAVDVGRKIDKDGLVSHHRAPPLRYIDLLVLANIRVQFACQDSVDFQLRA
jgi:hypothetical protein